MGIHCGQPLCEPDPITKRMDYFGPMVNRSARISGNAAGGQIMISADIAREINAKILETEPETEYSDFQPPLAVNAIKDLEKLYVSEAGLKRRTPVIAYCRIGERSSHTWFVLQYLLGFPKVKNYDGSWTEWGNTVGVPIEKGLGQAAPRPEPVGSGS
jgi:rhodanese-related sulfurtransferase